MDKAKGGELSVGGGGGQGKGVVMGKNVKQLYLNNNKK